jgi:large subunit ribosomal protein L25
MKHPHLKAEERKVLGKKVKKLRREGYLPGNVYGKGLNSHAIQVKLEDFESVYKEAGETGLVDLTYDEKTKPVLIKNLQLNYATRTLLHVDFYQVNLKEKVKSTVPVVLIGEAKAVTDKVGLVLQTVSEIEVEALPDKLPENIEIPVEHLAEIGDQVTVADIKAPEDVTILTDPSQTVVKIAEPTVEEVEPVAEAAEGEAEEEGAAKTEGGEETKSEEQTTAGEENATTTPSEEKKD